MMSERPKFRENRGAARWDGHVGYTPPMVRARGVVLLLAWLTLALLALGACQHTAEPLPTLGRVGEFSLVDQQARTVSAETLRGKVWVAAFFFSRCPTICPRITRRMRALQVATSASKPALSLVSFSVDPENDTPQVLLAYAQRYGADLQTWAFLTGDLAVVQRTVVDGFKLALDGKPDPNAENGGIIHGSHLVLVDRALGIRGYYRTDDEDDMKRLLDDAKRL
jgi:protein SCO1/2